VEAQNSISKDKIGEVRRAPRMRRSALFCILSKGFILVLESSPRTLQPYSSLLRMKAMYTRLSREQEAPHFRELNARSTFKRLRQSARIDFI